METVTALIIYTLLVIILAVNHWLMSKQIWRQNDKIKELERIVQKYENTFYVVAKQMRPHELLPAKDHETT